MKIFLASDHAGFEIKEAVRLYLVSLTDAFMQSVGSQEERVKTPQSCIDGTHECVPYSIKDFGTFDNNPIDYVDTGLLAAEAVAKESGNPDPAYGILVCGTGQGMNMIANKVKSIRACLCLTPEFAKLARQHNDANILVLAGRFIEPELAIEIVRTFLNEPFSDEVRHKNRINKIDKYEVTDGKHQKI